MLWPASTRSPSEATSAGSSRAIWSTPPVSARRAMTSGARKRTRGHRRGPRRFRCERTGRRPARGTRPAGRCPAPRRPKQEHIPKQRTADRLIRRCHGLSCVTAAIVSLVSVIHRCPANRRRPARNPRRYRPKCAPSPRRPPSRSGRASSSPPRLVRRRTRPRECRSCPRSSASRYRAMREVRRRPSAGVAGVVVLQFPLARIHELGAEAGAALAASRAHHRHRPAVLAVGVGVGHPRPLVGAAEPLRGRPGRPWSRSSSSTPRPAEAQHRSSSSSSQKKPSSRSSTTIADDRPPGTHALSRVPLNGSSSTIFSSSSAGSGMLNGSRLSDRYGAMRATRRGSDVIRPTSMAPFARIP